jgi:hypothetical protein
MSTKIYEAYRFPLADIAVTPQAIQRQARDIARERVDKWIDQLITNEAPLIEEALEKAKASGKPVSRSEVEWVLRLKYREQYAKPEKNIFDFNIWARLWIHEDHVYLVPGNGMAVRDVWKFLETFPGVEEYAYWNNVDLPDGMDEDAWGERGVNWDAIMDHKEDDSLILDVLSPDMWDKCSPEYARIMKAWADENDDEGE